jgi:dTMP kinase
MTRGHLITFEGTDGSGKTTQIQLAKEFLEKKGYDVIASREPGGTEMAEEIRKLIKNGPPRANLTETLLFEAARADYVASLIKPHLEKGRVVLSDRYTDSTLAYQGYASGGNLSAIVYFNIIASQGYYPDLTFFLDVPIEEGLEASVEKDKIEARGPSFMERVRQGYLNLAKQYPLRIKVIPRETPENVHRKISGHLAKYFGF